MANARHPKARSFVQQKLFVGLSAFAELEQRISNLPDEKSRGDAFEVFAERSRLLWNAGHLPSQGDYQSDCSMKSSAGLSQRISDKTGDARQISNINATLACRDDPATR